MLIDGPSPRWDLRYVDQDLPFDGPQDHLKMPQADRHYPRDTNNILIPITAFVNPFFHGAGKDFT
jgi:hypothetical protein